jgi:hypothetical protein
MGSRSTVRRACRMVAMWSIFTPSVGTPSISLSTLSGLDFTGNAGWKVSDASKWMQ